VFSNPEVEFGGRDRLLGLVEKIYATIDQPALWDSVVKEISETLEGDSIMLFANFPDVKTPIILALDMAEDASKAFADYYATINPLMQRCEQNFLPGTSWFSHHAMQDVDFEKTEFYNDFFRRHEMYYTVGLRIPFGDAAAGSISCQRPKAAGAFGEQADTIIQTLRPHLQRAFALHHKMSEMNSKTLGLAAALDACDQAVFCLGRDGRVLSANGRAEALLQRADALRLRNERLHATLPEMEGALQSTLAAAVNALTFERAAAPERRFLLLERKSGGPPLRITAAPFVSGRETWVNGVAALVFVQDAAQPAGSRGDAMRVLYGLTPTEIRVAEHLLAGRDARELAGRMHITLETARFHVKRVLGKTGTRRQTELMRLMLSMPGR